jgi:serine/threonine protein kinase
MDLVVKRFIDRTKGRLEYSVMRMLWEKGFNRESALRIPRPFFFLEDLSLLIEEKAHGVLLRKNLRHNSPITSGGLKAAARWLIKLHHVDADDEGIPLHPDDKTSIRGWVHRIGNREPELLPKLEELSSLIERKLSSFKNLRFTLIHGDFQSDNIFIDKEKVTVIDFGRFCKSDPARDLSCMIAQTRTISFLETASPGSVLPLNAFWEDYLTAVSVGERESLSERTCTFVAIKYLENIDYISSFSREKGKDVSQLLLNDAKRFAKANRVEEIL